MGIRKIVTIGDDTLRKHCKPQEKFDKRLATLLKDMADTMYKAEGVGLAAPQVGILRRIAVVEVEAGEVIELINPRIIAFSGEQQAEEGCLSIPERWGVTSRPLCVTVRAMDRTGQERDITGKDLLARALCHEIDHLDGKLFIDKLIKEVN